MDFNRWWSVSHYALKGMLLFSVFTVLIGVIMFCLGISCSTLNLDVSCPDSGMEEGNSESSQHVIEGFYFVCGILQIVLGLFGVFSLLKLHKGMVIGLIVGLSILAVICAIFSFVAIALVVAINSECDDDYQCDPDNPCACVMPAILQGYDALISSETCDKLVPLLNSYIALQIIWAVFGGIASCFGCMSVSRLEIVKSQMSAPLVG